MGRRRPEGGGGTGVGSTNGRDARAVVGHCDVGGSALFVEAVAGRGAGERIIGMEGGRGRSGRVHLVLEEMASLTFDQASEPIYLQKVY